MLVRKLHRQHNSVVLTVPRPVLAALEVTAGDHVGIDICDVDHEVYLFKIHNRRPRDAESIQNQSEQDKGGRT